MDHPTMTYTHIHVIAPAWQTIASSPKRVTSSPPPLYTRDLLLPLSTDPASRNEKKLMALSISEERSQPTARPSSPSSSSSGGTSVGGGGCLWTAVEETPVVVVGRQGCCMGHVVKRLLQGLGVNPAMWEIAEDAEEAAMRAELDKMDPLGSGGRWQATLPAVFIGGRLVGGLDHLMAAHISGALVPTLKEAGALWL
ncbi:hypothetical protein HPP92_023028 [Vanilla planifolia]|uniref:Glutaredoxin domain-containing protein n=1 Tax=Vanilla planifolia TaxID=51239 RepID=A0A835PWH5_VANPL|nr:hypothetical protein HPP92_023028 [Vanilla planifolia]